MSRTSCSKPTRKRKKTSNSNCCGKGNGGLSDAIRRFFLKHPFPAPFHLPAGPEPPESPCNAVRNIILDYQFPHEKKAGPDYLVIAHITMKHQYCFSHIYVIK